MTVVALMSVGLFILLPNVTRTDPLPSARRREQAAAPNLS